MVLLLDTQASTYSTAGFRTEGVEVSLVCLPGRKEDVNAKYSQTMAWPDYRGRVAPSSYWNSASNSFWSNGRLYHRRHRWKFDSDYPTAG